MSELETAHNINSGGSSPNPPSSSSQPVKPASTPRSDDDHTSAGAVPHPMHDKIILGLMIVTIIMVCLWLIMLWAPESNDEVYQSVVTSSSYVSYYHDRCII